MTPVKLDENLMTELVDRFVEGKDVRLRIETLLIQPQTDRVVEMVRVLDQTLKIHRFHTGQVVVYKREMEMEVEIINISAEAKGLFYHNDFIRRVIFGF